MVAHRERKKEAPDLKEEDGTENTASCVERQTDEQNNAEEGREPTWRTSWQ
jgi:hypothetical protein